MGVIWHKVWFEAGDENIIVLSGETTEKNNIAIGDTVNLNLGELGTSEREVIGTYRVVYSSGFVCARVCSIREPEVVYPQIESINKNIPSLGCFC